MDAYLGDGDQFAIEFPLEFGYPDEGDSDWPSEVDLVSRLVLQEVVLSPLDGPKIQYLHRSLFIHTNLINDEN